MSAGLSEFELGILAEINENLDKLQKKIDRMIIVQAWLNDLKKDVEAPAPRRDLYV